MKKLATAAFAVLALTAATSALALDVHQPVNGTRVINPTKTLPRVLSPTHIHAFVGCTDGVPASAYYFYADDRMGNLFDFGTGTQLTKLQFAHYGYGTPGPYDYDIELWDPFSCTFISSKNNLVAADAAASIQVETVDLCSANLYSTGLTVVTIDANTCNDPTDCYPDLLYDDQIDVFCPVIISNASTSAACYDVSGFNGPFLMIGEFNNCTSGIKQTTWGNLKNIYR
jgi:hypothetical protein